MHCLINLPIQIVNISSVFTKCGLLIRYYDRYWMEQGTRRCLRSYLHIVGVICKYLYMKESAKFSERISGCARERACLI